MLPWMATAANRLHYVARLFGPSPLQSGLLWVPQDIGIGVADSSAIFGCLLAILAIESGDYSWYASVAGILEPKKVGPFPLILLMIRGWLREPIFG